MKITCTNAEKEHFITRACVANECYFPFKCIDNCKKCLEEKIEWEVTDDECGKG